MFVYLPGGGGCGSLRRVTDEFLPDDAAGLRAANAGLRAVVEARDAENALLRAELGAAREREPRLELRLAELERRLGMDSTDSGTPSSKERIGAREARRARQQSERERRKDRKRGGQPGPQGKGLERDPDPGEAKTAEPPAECLYRFRTHLKYCDLRFGRTGRLRQDRGSCASGCST